MTRNEEIPLIRHEEITMKQNEEIPSKRGNNGIPVEIDGIEITFEIANERANEILTHGTDIENGIENEILNAIDEIEIANDSPT